jgi:hypothetical protein
MQRPSRKQILVWTVSVLFLAAILSSLPPVRLQYYKWRLESVKDRKTRLLAGNPSALDIFWLSVTGNPISGQELDAAIHRHEAALVRLGFLEQEKLPPAMVACPQTLETLDDLRTKCPWYDAQTISGTNLLITSCPKMMERWRKRAHELGW